MIWILNRGFGAERMPSQRGKVYCTGWCWYIGRSKRGHRGKANSAPRLGVSLGARARPRIANLSRLLDASPHILVLYLFSNITPPGEVQHDGQIWLQARFPTSLYHTALAPDSQPAVSKTRPRSKRPLLLVVWTGLSIRRQNGA